MKLPQQIIDEVKLFANTTKTVGFRRSLDAKKPALRPVFSSIGYLIADSIDDSIDYLAMRSFDRFVPIWLKVVTIWLAEVSRKNLLESLAQFCSRVEVGSLSVFTWII